MGPIQRVNVDMASGMREELDGRQGVEHQSTGGQAVIRALIRQALEQCIWRERTSPLSS